MSKTVFVLGAGFSLGAGAPPQDKLVEKIFELHKKDPFLYEPNSVEYFQTFLRDTLNIPDNSHNKVPLEDIFTPLDRCLLDNLSFRNLGIDEIKRTRELIYYLIGKTLQHILQSTNKKYIDEFAGYLVHECSKRSKGRYRSNDNVSVITTNWDILLDRSIQNLIDAQHRSKAVVDYCCYISSYHESDERVKPGLEMLGKGGFNIKLLKLHGSLNWLQCPRCQRVYVDLDSKIAIDQYSIHQQCRHCDNNYGSFNSHELTSNIIMPTFLKNLSNPQYKLIWQNAGVELSEASKVVFIGYSLPQADYEMRQLISRMVRSDAEVGVVDFSSDPTIDKNYVDLISRYKIFFGKRLKFESHDGAEKYIETLTV